MLDPQEEPITQDAPRERSSRGACWITVAWVWHSLNNLRKVNISTNMLLHSQDLEMCLRSQCTWPQSTTFLSLSPFKRHLDFVQAFKQTYPADYSSIVEFMNEKTMFILVQPDVSVGCVYVNPTSAIVHEILTRGVNVC